MTTSDNILSIVRHDIHGEPLFQALIPENGCIVLPQALLTLQVMYHKWIQGIKKKKRQLVLGEIITAGVTKTMPLHCLAELLKVNLDCLHMANEGDPDLMMMPLSKLGEGTTVEMAGLKNGVVLRAEPK